MRSAVIARNMGLVLLVNALFMFISVVVSILYGFDTGFFPLLLAATITVTVGALPFIFIKKAEDIATREGYVIAVLSWVVSCLFGMLPYVFWGGEFSLINAWYESVSGFTTTGSTILTSVEALPHSLLFWRAATQWIGGMGVVLFMLLILPEVSSVRLRLSRIEISSLSQDSYRFRAKETIRVIAYVYFGLTLLQTFCLVLAGMTFFDAVCHAFATIATGGFSTRNASIASYDSVAIEVIMLVFMAVSSLPFGLIFLLIVKRSTSLFTSPVTRYYLISTLAVSVLVSANLWIGGTYGSFGTALRHGVFQTFSLVSTAGFSSADSSMWPAFSMLLLFFLIFQGGCSGSTAGGIKADRFLIAFQSIRAHITKKLHPHSVVPVRVGGQVIDPDMVEGVNLFIVLFFFVLFVTALVLTVTGLQVIEALVASVVHLVNVGPGFGSVASVGNCHDLGGFSKFVLSLAMIMGRIELFGFFILFSARK